MDMLLQPLYSAMDLLTRSWRHLSLTQRLRHLTYTFSGPYGVEALHQFKGIPYTTDFYIAFALSVPASYLHGFIPGNSSLAITLRHAYAFLIGALVCVAAYGILGLVPILGLVLITWVAIRLVPSKAGYVTFVGAFAYLLYVQEFLMIDHYSLGSLMTATLQVVSCAMDFQDAHVAQLVTDPGPGRGAKHRDSLARGKDRLAQENVSLARGKDSRHQPGNQVRWGGGRSKGRSSDSKEVGGGATAKQKKCTGGGVGNEPPTAVQDGVYRGDIPGCEPAIFQQTPLVAAPPSLLELLGYTFNCGLVLFGPNNFFADYKAWTERTGDYNWAAGQDYNWAAGQVRRPWTLLPALGAVLQSVLCMAVESYVVSFYDSKIFESPHVYMALPFWRRWFLCWQAVAEARWRYYAIWSMCEAAAVAGGLNFSGWKRTKQASTDAAESGEDKGEATWERNLHCHVLFLEFAPSTVVFIRHWNMAVGRWIRSYAYTRLVPKGQKPGLLQFAPGTVVFIRDWNMAVGCWICTYAYTRLVPTGQKPGLLQVLLAVNLSALWHGLSPGFYLFFSGMGLTLYSSRLIYRWQKRIGPEQKVFRLVADVAHRIFTLYCTSFCGAAFCVKTWRESYTAWSGLYFSGVLLPALVIVVDYLVNSRTKSKRD